MSGVPLSLGILAPESRFTTKNPKVHRYNPITHLNQSVDFGAIERNKAMEATPRVTEIPGKRLSAERKFVRSVPRTIFSDPLTGRVIDVSQTPKRTTFRLNGSLAVGSEVPAKVSQSLNFSPRAAKTRVRSELYDPITNRKVVYAPTHHFVASLGTQERVPLTISDPLQIDTQSPRRRVEGVAYVNPYHIQ